MHSRFISLSLFALLAITLRGAALAAAPSAGASATTYVLVPYQAPESKDPHAATDTKDLAGDLAAAGINAVEIAPMEHLQAVAQAAKLCADSHATALLIPDGRSEQTMKRVPVPFLGAVVHYPTHVEFRLDEVRCDGVVAWSTTTTGDQSPGGLDSVGNLGGAVDAAFRSAIQDAAKAFASAPAPSAVTTANAPPAAAQPGAPITSYVMLPIAQPKMADPRAGDITQSLLTHLKKHSLNVTLATDPIDHLTAIDSASALCSTYKAQAIIVPDIRIEQSSYTGRSYAALRLTQIACDGAITSSGSGTADMGSGFIGNFGAAAVGVSERAMDPAIEAMLSKS